MNNSVEIEEPKALESNSVVQVSIEWEHGPSVLVKGIHYLPDMMINYSRKKELINSLENELEDCKKELWELREEIRLMGVQQGWKIEPI